VKDLLKTIQNLGRTKLISLGAVSFVLLVFFGFLISKTSNDNMVIVSEGLENVEIGKVIEKLEEMKIAYEINDRGMLYVSKDDKSKVLITLASMGVRSNIVGYELFDSVDSFSATNFMQNINNLRALEGELTRSVLSFSNIKNARVHINIPKKSIFSDEIQKSTGAVIVEPKKHHKLDIKQIKAIQNLVASAVMNMKPEYVKVIDTKGILLSQEEEPDDMVTGVKHFNEIKFKYEKRVQDQLENLLEKSLGFGKVYVSVNVDMDFNQLSENAEVFDPESKVIRSEHISDEKKDESDKESQMTIEQEIKEESVDKNTEQMKSNSSKSEKIKNYEISKVIKSIIKSPGEIKQISVAVLVDGTYAKDKDNKQIYTPRTEDELTKISTIVKSAIGFKKERNDKVEVVNMRFSKHEFDDEVLTEDKFLYGFKKDAVLSLLDKLIIGIILMFVIAIVVKPLLEKAVKMVSYKDMDIDTLMNFNTDFSMIGHDGKIKVVDPAVEKEKLLHPEEDMQDAIDVKKIDNIIEKSSLSGIVEIVDKHTNRTIVVLREWMYEDGENT